MSASEQPLRIAGIILAAGASRRMGHPKQLIEIDGEPLLDTLVRALRQGGCEDVVVVYGTTAEVETVRRAESAGARAVRNPDPASEQIDSLRKGLAAVAADMDAVIMTPVDIPGLSPDTVTGLIEAFRRQGAPIVVPTSEGKPGHPTLFARSVFPELLSGALPEGARTVIARHLPDASEVEVEDDRILGDLDTPDDLDRLG